MTDFILGQRDHLILIRGLIAVLALATPVNVFVAIMGGASPDGKGFLHSLALVVGMELGCVLGFLLIARMVDSILILGPAWTTFSYLGIFLGAIVFVIGFNVFVDNLFQFKQGNYALSIYGLLALLLFWGAVIFLGGLIGRFA
ncbi:MAG: hypothetical protein K8S54_11565 [Spirochaetia bacterium]|nr:hypothetical protein [Spirochaetia bacterium]